MLTIAESEDAEGTSILQATETKPGVKVVNSRLPDPRLNLIYRLEAAVGDPQDLGEISAGHRRIVPLTGGTFSGPELRGTLLPGASADWQIILSDGTALGDVRYTLETERGDLLYVQSRGVRHGSPDVLERLGRGEDVDAAGFPRSHHDGRPGMRTAARSTAPGLIRLLRAGAAIFDYSATLLKFAWPGEQVSLCVFASELAQHGELPLILDALCDNLYAERATDHDHRLHESGVEVIRPQALNKRLVNLQLIDWKPAQVCERRVTSAEVVDRHAHPDVPQLVEHGGEEINVLHQYRLGDLEAE